MDLRFPRPLATTAIGLLSAWLVAGCEVGALPSSSRGPSGNGVDAAPSDPGVDAGPGSDAAPAADCDPAILAGLPSGNHNAGNACLNPGCHAPGGGGPTFTLGGTVFDGVASATAVKGATIHVVDALGNDVPLISANNGNFWSQDPISFPVQVRASSCPSSQSMGGPVDAADASCNKSGCHDGDFRIHLP